MKYELKCEHDESNLKKEETIAGTVYICPKCKCLYRLSVAKNNTECWSKRFPVSK